MRRIPNRNANWNAVSRRRINGSFLADLLPVTRDRLALIAIEIGDTSKAPNLPEAVAERQESARTMAQAPWLRGSGGGLSSQLRKHRERHPVIA
jgi:hypothetical protein